MRSDLFPVPSDPTRPTRRRRFGRVAAAVLATAAIASVVPVVVALVPVTHDELAPAHPGAGAGGRDGLAEGASVEASDTDTADTADGGGSGAAPRAGELHGPDLVGPVRGGTAARLRDRAGEPVGGELYLLTGTPGSSARARVFDTTPFALAAGELHPDSVASNDTARDTVGALVGIRPVPIDLTGARGPGPSGGLVYALAHLDRVTHGGLTGSLRVAATGALQREGFVGPVSAIDEKVTAAWLAGVEVVFTPSKPDDEVLESLDARWVGWQQRAVGGATLAGLRAWDDYRTWGADRDPGRLDVVAVRHLGDVVAYLCGAGVDAACDVVAELDEPLEVPTLPSTDEADGPSAPITVRGAR